VKNPAESSFDVGDVVQLNSGGPLLTVQSIEIDHATVRWGEGQKLKTEKLPVSMLKCVSVNEVSNFEAARRIAFILRRAVHESPEFSEEQNLSLDEVTDFLLAETKWGRK
jgi:uncharacterized protein YodC (DUF2158 family)